MKELNIITVLLSIIVLFVVGAFLSLLQTVLLPFILAMFLSFLFRPVVLFLRKKRIPMLLVLLLVVLTLAAALFGVTMILTSSIASFVGEAPSYQAKLTTLVNQVLVQVDTVSKAFGISSGAFKLSDAIQVGSITKVLSAGLGTLVTVFSNILIILFFLMFILAGSGDLISKIDDAFPHSQSIRISRVLGQIDGKVRKYLMVKTFISFCTGALATLMLFILGVDYPLLWGFIMFLMNFIPNVGSLAATFFPVLMAFLQFDSPGRPLLVFILLVVTQNVIGNIIEPKLMAFSLNLSPLLVLMSLIFWGWLWGIIGMILAIPLMSIIKIVAESVSVLRPVAILMSGKSLTKA